MPRLEYGWSCVLLIDELDKVDDGFGASIYYATGGSTPSMGSTLYSVPIRVRNRGPFRRWRQGHLGVRTGQRLSRLETL